MNCRNLASVEFGFWYCNHLLSLIHVVPRHVWSNDILVCFLLFVGCVLHSRFVGLSFVFGILSYLVNKRGLI